MPVNPVSLRNLKKFESKSEKAIQAPLAKKNFALKLEQPVQDILDSLPVKDRLTLVRKAIAKELIQKGLLELPTKKGSHEYSN